LNKTQTDSVSPADSSSSWSTYRILVHGRSPQDDQAGRKLVTVAHELGLTGLTGCRQARLYLVRGELTSVMVDRLANELLADPVTEVVEIMADDGVPAELDSGDYVEVSWLPGVSDSAGDNLVRAAQVLGLSGVRHAATGYHYRLTGDWLETPLHQLATTVFSNPVVQRYSLNRPVRPPFFEYQAADGLVEHIALTTATDEVLLQISKERRLALNLAEMRAIQDYFRDAGREPTDVELEMLAQTWSEHCVHKTFKATIDYTGPDGQTERIAGLLNQYIRAATEKVNKPWVRSAFVDNAGIIAFDEEYDLAFKVETHNHPSALEPFGGANTGVGGVVRDVLGVSARPIANTDILCFGPPDITENDLPAGVLHPRRIAEGVIHGIEDYGNKMGIPTVNGAIHYHPGYLANPLVYCGCLGILPRNSHPTAAQPGDYIVAIGGRTGRDGLRGATFSSMEMDQTTGEIAATAVQIGNPIIEKQVQEVILQARDERLYTAITDCGAGGFSSAVGEMGEAVGAEVQLAAVPLKFPGLRPWEIWLSEAQERMVLAVPPANWPRLQEICAGQDVEAVRLGTFEPSKRIRIYDGDRLVGDLSMAFLHDGLPPRVMPAHWSKPAVHPAQSLAETPPGEHQALLLAMLAHPTVRSKEEVVRRYDHEVQGGTVIKPSVGKYNHGPGDAAVLWPLDTQMPARSGQRRQGAALGNGLCPQYSAYDPYVMAWAAVDEALRNVVAVGADPDRVAILDNFCWGNPNLPDRLGGLVRCAQGCHDAAVAFGVPFVSGKDSLNNEYTGADGQKHAIPGTLLISALGIVPDVSRAMTMDLKAAENWLFVIGDTRPEFGGSLAHAIGAKGLLDSGGAPVKPPQPVRNGLARLRAVHQALSGGLVQACHDCSEGGLAVALAEMAIAGRIGVEIDSLENAPHEGEMAVAALLYAESLNRFVVEVSPDDAGAFAQLMAETNTPFGRIGQTTAEKLFVVAGEDGNPLLHHAIDTLEIAWRGHIPNRPASPESHTPVSTPLTTTFSSPTSAPKVLVLHANGTNRDREAAQACALAGGDPEIVYINQLMQGERALLDYHMLVLPGGFSYGDDLGAGVLWAVDFRHRLGETLQRFVDSGRPVLGICNGFQALVKAGLLPVDPANGQRQVTLTYNESAQFECRWVMLQPHPAGGNLFTAGLAEPIYCPVAHGEGRFAVQDRAMADQLRAADLVALTYIGDDYPSNPNGSVQGIAGIGNPAGNILGLMPHPENHIYSWQHPQVQRGKSGLLGLPLFRNGIKNC